MRIRSVAVASLSTALLVGAVVPAAAQDDPYQLLTQAVQSTAAATSFHLLAEANGTLNMGQSMGNVAFPSMAPRPRATSRSTRRLSR